MLVIDLGTHLGFGEHNPTNRLCSCTFQKKYVYVRTAKSEEGFK